MPLRRVILAPVLSLSACLVSLPAAAADAEMTDDQAVQLSNAIFADITRGKPAAAIEKADQLIAAFNLRQARRAHVCAESNEQAEALARHNDREVTMELTIVGAAWCDGYFAKGYAMIDLGKGKDALPWLQLAHDRAPLNAHYTNELAEWFKSQRDWTRSYGLFEEALKSAETAPGDRRPFYKARALRGMGFAKIEMGQLDEAEALFNQSLTFEPNSPAAMNELKYIKQIRGKPNT
ncbi:tetratricopeptide repeat protein [Novosphingobium jiangmenense]|uniref:Tetratricopeptide repeat protein n=1 Tax=Novosphingobium jiangmenense TaxID=2791981 RepID=A0ABS0HFG2_9SPHN|nr:tetratricopeptide repeat protein [Novosphingobium jiangmenense]MBF9150711.1 tetratricopeptide repeat protein [Novosphingobium jiangmenense]